MKKICIVHGTKGSPEGNWFSWLKDQLVSRGHDVYVPAMPTPTNQSRENWCATLREQAPGFDSDTVLIGHSCGATFLLHVLEGLKSPVAQSVFVSPVMEDIHIPEYDELNKTFVHHNFNWGKICNNAGKINILHGDNDPYVPVEQAEFLGEKLGVPVDIIPDGGHLNAETGYTEFPKVLELLL